MNIEIISSTDSVHMLKLTFPSLISMDPDSSIRVYREGDL